LAVGPVAVASLMTGAAASQFATQGSPEFLGVVVAIAMIAGILLIAMGLLRLGFLANFLSHPVISGFITAAAIQIAAGQVGPLLGIRTHGENLLEILTSLAPNLVDSKPVTAAIGFAAFAFLLWARRGLKPLLLSLGLNERLADILAKTGPAMTIIATTTAVWGLGLEARGVGILGDVLSGLPSLTLPPIDIALWQTILIPALLISIVGYVESISVALTLAAKRRQRVNPDQELIALGIADIGAASSGAFPVTGALSRSVVNFDSGAQTPAAGPYTAVGVALATLFLTPLLFYLPKHDSGCDYHCRGPLASRHWRTQTNMALFVHRLCRHDRHHPVDLGAWRRGGAHSRCGTVDLSPPLRHLKTACGSGRSASGNHEFPQHSPP